MKVHVQFNAEYIKCALLISRSQIDSKSGVNKKR